MQANRRNHFGPVRKSRPPQAYPLVPSAVSNVGSLSSIPILSSPRNEIAESGRRGEHVYLSDLPDCWLPPDNIYANSDWKREEIATNIQEGLRLLGVVFEVA